MLLIRKSNFCPNNFCLYTKSGSAKKSDWQSRLWYRQTTDWYSFILNSTEGIKNTDNFGSLSNSLQIKVIFPSYETYTLVLCSVLNSLQRKK